MVKNNWTEEEILKRIESYNLFNMKGVRDSYDKVLNKDPADIYKKPTNLYLFKTKYDGIYKFGITQFHPNKRANTTKGKEFYEELIFHIELEDRYTAIAIEQAIKYLRENFFIFRNLTTDWKKKTWLCPDDILILQEYDKPKFCKKVSVKQEKMFTYGLTEKEINKLIKDTKKTADQLGINKDIFYYSKGREGMTELTRMDITEFEYTVNEIESFYKEVNAWEFGKKYFPSRIKCIQKQIDDVLIRKECIYTVQFGYVGQYWEYDWENRDCDDPRTLKRKKLKPPYHLNQKKDEKAFYVPIKDLPEAFKKYNKVNLFHN